MTSQKHDPILKTLESPALRSTRFLLSWRELGFGSRRSHETQAYPIFLFWLAGRLSWAAGTPAPRYQSPDQESWPLQLFIILSKHNKQDLSSSITWQ